MNNQQPKWQSLLDWTEFAQYTLAGGLFTSFDRPDSTFLAEHFLPAVLKIQRQPETDRREQPSFLIELHQKLQALHGRLAVISSLASQEANGFRNPTISGYDWIWNSIRHSTTGRRGPEVQHAKLWLLYWKGNDDKNFASDRLEVVVSSANLNRDAFQRQIQAVCRFHVEMESKPAQKNLKSWGILVPFLQNLTSSAGVSTEAMAWLSRATCPTGFQFLASIPGKHSPKMLKSTPWGQAALKHLQPKGKGSVIATVMSPYVGSWRPDQLTSWCASFQGRPNHTRLVWIEKNHPWASHKFWQMPSNSLDTFVRSGVELLNIRTDSSKVCNKDKSNGLIEESNVAMHEQHQKNDERWSHAKIYLFRRGNSKRLFITSANFSPSAWGTRLADNSLMIKNFEIGIAIDQATDGFSDHLQAFEPSQTPYVNDEGYQIESPSDFLWARAHWDGKTIQIEARGSAMHDLQGKLQVQENESTFFQVITNWQITTDQQSQTASMEISGSQRPRYVHLQMKNLQTEVFVFDDRPEDQRRSPDLTGVDPKLAARLMDELLFERYGKLNSFDDDGELSSEGSDEGSKATEKETQQPADYTVAVFAQAREYFQIINNWWSSFQKASQTQQRAELDFLKRDGKMLAEAFKRREQLQGLKVSHAPIAARLACEEMRNRLTSISGDDF